MAAADQQSQIKNLIALGKEKGFLTFAEVSDSLPEIVDSEQIDDVITMIQGMGIPVHDEAPDTEAQLFSEPAVAAAEDDEEAAEEAAAALAASDSEFGRTTDPVRMYMREMGSVELLDREGEIRIAKRIEEGLGEALYAMASYPETVAILLEQYDNAINGKKRLAEVVVGFFDPNAPVPVAPEEVLPPEVAEIEPEVVEALRNAVVAAYPKLSHRYYALKAKWLGLDKLQVWDRNAPLPIETPRLVDWAEARKAGKSSAADLQTGIRLATERKPAMLRLIAENPELAIAEVQWALEHGLEAMWVPHRLAGDRSPTHLDYYPIWAMLQEAQVVITPGSGFGSAGEGYFRISAFNSRANVEEVCRRLKALVA